MFWRGFGAHAPNVTFFLLAPHPLSGVQLPQMAKHKNRLQVEGRSCWVTRAFAEKLIAKDKARLTSDRQIQILVSTPMAVLRGQVFPLKSKQGNIYARCSEKNCVVSGGLVGVGRESRKALRA